MSQGVTISVYTYKCNRCGESRPCFMVVVNESWPPQSCPSYEDPLTADWEKVDPKEMLEYIKKGE